MITADKDTCTSCGSCVDVCHEHCMELVDGAVVIMILNRSKAVRSRLQLGKHERIFGTLGLGYPAVRFSNKVRGRALPIQWNEGA
jgi:ferredoxin